MVAVLGLISFRFVFNVNCFMLIAGCAGGRGSKPIGTLRSVARTPFFVEQVKEEPIAEEEPAGPSC